MAKKAIKTDLFRFVTLRTPQLINEQRKDIGFIFHPDTTQSAFLKDVAENTSVEDARSLVLTAAGTFADPLTSYLKVKSINQDLYNFSSWLMNNRNSLTETEVAAKTAGLTVLDSASELKLWDNLHYQVIKKKSSYVRQACIQMIVANNFLKKFADYDDAVIKTTEEEYLVRLANAKVIIDKAFTKQSEETDTCCTNVDGVVQRTERIADTYMANKSIEVFDKAIEDLKVIKNSYDSAYNNAYKTAFAEYEKNLETLTKEAEEKQKEAQITENNAAKTEGRDPYVIALDMEAPAFEFSFHRPLENLYIKNLSAETSNIIATLKLHTLETIEEAISIVEKSRKKEVESLFNNEETVKKTLVVNGVTLRPEVNQLLSPFCYVIQTKKERPGPFSTQPRIAVLFTLNLGDTDAVIESQNHKIIYNGTTVNSNQVFLMNQTNGIVALRLFSDQSIFTNGLYYDLSGEFVLSNGKKITYNQRVYTSKTYTHGCGEVSGAGNGETPAEVNLYGVGKIGVADFRKVEQEVCCYVPGEVSHIENILAREYKERATRNLTSVETTSETTSEKEIENLTDTTTTERNELSSEVSTVLNEDQSQAYGASAGVSGSYGKSMKFSADAYADFANSSSSSQSNSVAQTYAQEVTDRALERIVQKTTKKRTSRILKEFEENNKHGFDNREGDQHVSGVYRWIDIIYKNKLVNYGKRLMYEFMVPEPSRFFKEAVIKGGEESDQIFTLEEPVHPSDLNGSLAINGPDDITKYNYQRIAGIYNAEITAMPEETIAIGKGFSMSGGVEHIFQNDSADIDIPEGYVAKRAKAYMSGMQWPPNGKGIAIGVGDVKFRIGQFNYTREHEFPYETFDMPFTKKLPMSVYYCNYHTANVNISAELELTDEGLAKWQNETFNAIMNAYNDRLQEYKEAKLAAGIGINGETERMRFNPLFNRALEKRELKRICIEMLARPYGNPLDKNNYTEDANNLPLVAQNAEFENHAAHVKFFEQAFDWEIMAYLFYPYYWADRKDWKDLYQQTDAADPIFQAFLQSGMARTVVPVRPGFEDAVAYYMETGDIWNGGDLVVDHEDDLYVSIAEEMQTVDGEVEELWESRVPTSLTMIQKDTVGLEETGLPCCDFVLDADGGGDYTNPIQPKTNLIGGESTGTESTSGATKTTLEDPVLTTKS